MLKIYKQIISLGFIVMMSVQVLGQNTSSPYSMYGVGELGNMSFGRSTGMGGLSAPLYSASHLNPENPASYMALGQNSFIFEIGATSEYLMLETPSSTYDNFNANFSFLAIGFPITKWWKSGVGIAPLTSIGYDIQQVIEMDYDGGKVITSYSGSGGITNFYFDNSFKIIKSLSVGVKLSYLFGPLINNETSTSINNSSTSIINRRDKSNISSLAFKTGLHFHKKISDKMFLNIGATYGLNSELSATDKLFITNVVSRLNGVFIDTIADKTVNVGVLQLPQSFSFGASLNINKKIEFGADYSRSDWSESKYFDRDPNFADDEKVALGLEYIPDLNAIAYAKAIRYRIGANFSKSYLVYEDDQLQTYGIALGVGLPLKRNPSIINFTVNYKKRYIPGNNILSEHYLLFQFNMSLHAIWFKKTVWE